MWNVWSYVAIFFIVALIFPVLPIALGIILGPKRPTSVKLQPYECGVETVGDSWVQFKAQYYIFALVFLVFDVELVFLYPWAVAYDLLPLYAVFEGVLFILLLMVALIYAWRKGALEWF